MRPRLLRVALTGGIATGKSYCLQHFASLHVPVIDADALAREAVAPGSPGLHAVAARFGPALIVDGALDREALARVVFADAMARADLEAIVHPLVYRAIAVWFDDLARAGSAPLAIADIPLLYETRHEGDFDRVVVAACQAPCQLARLMARDGLSESDARRRIASQLPIEQKRERADYVIDTDGGTAETSAAVERVLERLREDAAALAG